MELTGTASQIEWARQIRPRVDAEFDRVVAALNRVAAGQRAEDRAGTLAIVELVEVHRRAVMANCSAGYFLREWRELGDQVRIWLGRDARYQAIRDARVARRRLAPQV